MRRRPIGQTVGRWAVLIIVGGYLLLPLFAMGEFSTRGDFGGRSLDAWFAIVDSPNLIQAIIVTLAIAAITSVGMMLLLFANAFSAYATAASLVSQGAPIVPLQIREALTSEVVLGQENVGKALALGMIVVVVAVMGLYALVQRRAGRWLR